VQAGEVFQAEILRKVDVPMKDGPLALGVLDEALDDPHSIPTGRWRDGLCDCFIHGCCHALCCLTYWCQHLALGQVMHRMKLSIWGDPVRSYNDQRLSPFKFMLILTAALFFTGLMIGLVNPTRPLVVVNPDGTVSLDQAAFDAFVKQMQVGHVLDLIAGLFFLFLTVKTRQHIRRVYAIPESRSCIGMEDLCCSFWCGCCVVAQMARHTADYKKYHPACCTETGMNEHSPRAMAGRNGVAQVSPHIV
jgi:Cys-rich protein (TIGR01571 family)